MALGKMWTIAYRDLLRNRRRSFFTMIAVAFGLALIIFMSGMIAGMLESSIQDNIRLNTGHVQVRAESYEDAKRSLLWRDLLDNGAGLAAQANAMSEVQAASQVLWFSGVLSTPQETIGLRVTGVDPPSAIHDPIRQGIVAGEYLAPDDRNGILIGKRLADEVGVSVGQRVSLAAGNASGDAEEDVFTVRGLFATGFPGYDESTAFMPLSRAQAFTGTGERASAVVILLHDQEDADRVSAALAGPGLVTPDWRDLNSVLLTAFETGVSFYYLMYAIVILIVAVIIANTLLMAVFERTREIGILSALGMKPRHIRLMILVEAATLALGGIAVGIILGSIVVTWLSRTGIPIGDSSSQLLGTAMTFGTTMYTSFVPADILTLSFFMLAIVLLVSLYPAWYASRLEPVTALQAL
jgi:ABC-type lipoprotein release transport system permease subunit